MKRGSDCGQILRTASTASRGNRIRLSKEPAIRVPPVIGKRGKELVKKIAMGHVELHDLKTGLKTAAGRFCEIERSPPRSRSRAISRGRGDWFEGEGTGAD